MLLFEDGRGNRSVLVAPLVDVVEVDKVGLLSNDDAGVLLLLLTAMLPCVTKRLVVGIPDVFAAAFELYRGRTIRDSVVFDFGTVLLSFSRGVDLLSIDPAVCD